MSKSKTRPDHEDQDADNDAKADILRRVRSIVWAGKDDADEIAIMIEEEFGDEAGEDWVEEAIQREVVAKRKEEKTWPKVTDFDRLDRAFTILEAQGIIALHRAGFTQSDGLEEVEDAYQKAGGKNSDYAGHCFYTEQDQEGALDGRGLYIGFGHLSGNNAKGVEVGKPLRAAMEREGFKVEWDGTIGARLYVKKFCWQRRGPK